MPSIAVDFSMSMYTKCWNKKSHVSLNFYSLKYSRFQTPRVSSISQYCHASLPLILSYLEALSIYSAMDLLPAYHFYGPFVVETSSFDPRISSPSTGSSNRSRIYNTSCFQIYSRTGSQILSCVFLFLTLAQLGSFDSARIAQAPHPWTSSLRTAIHGFGRDTAHFTRLLNTHAPSHHTLKPTAHHSLSIKI